MSETDAAMDKTMIGRQWPAEKLKMKHGLTKGVNHLNNIAKNSPCSPSFLEDNPRATGLTGSRVDTCKPILPILGCKQSRRDGKEGRAEMQQHMRHTCAALSMTINMTIAALGMVCQEGRSEMQQHMRQALAAHGMCKDNAREGSRQNSAATMNASSACACLQSEDMLPSLAFTHACSQA
eukprot:1160632-Pelagomonas_calceolata.AAC.5